VEGLELAQKVADRLIESAFLSQLGIVALKTGRLEQAGDWARTALALRAELGMRLWTTDNLVTMATAHWLAGPLKPWILPARLWTFSTNVAAKGQSAPNKTILCAIKFLARQAK